MYVPLFSLQYIGITTCWRALESSAPPLRWSLLRCVKDAALSPPPLDGAAAAAARQQFIRPQLSGLRVHGGQSGIKI